MSRPVNDNYLPASNNNKSILLIEPPFYRLYHDKYSLGKFPLSLGYLAGTIRKETDWDVLAYNADFVEDCVNFQIRYLAGEGFENYLKNLKNPGHKVWKEVRETISEYRPSIIGISSKSQNFASVQMVARIAKDIDHNIMVIVGGPHPSMVGKKVLECPDIDIAVKGEGELTIVELLDKLSSNSSIDSLDGILYRKNGEFVENPDRIFIKDLDSLCYPSEEALHVLKDYDKYPKKAFKFIFATRGCSFNCLFCGSRNIWSRKVRFRSPEDVVREIKSLHAKGIRNVHFDDDTFGVNKKYIKDLCLALRELRPRIKWGCEINAKLVDADVLSEMKSAGCFQILLGIESGNNEILKKIRKNITIEKAIASAKMIRDRGIALSAFFIVGFPQETEQTLKDTVEAMKAIAHLGGDIIYSIFTPYPGTEMFELCKEQGLVDDDFDVSLFNHQSPANYFCNNIPQERFRVFLTEIEYMVDRFNNKNLLKKVLSSGIIERIRETGIKNSFIKFSILLKRIISRR